MRPRAVHAAVRVLGLAEVRGHAHRLADLEEAMAENARQDVLLGRLVTHLEETLVTVAERALEERR